MSRTRKIGPITLRWRLDDGHVDVKRFVFTFRVERDEIALAPAIFERALSGEAGEARLSEKVLVRWDAKGNAHVLVKTPKLVPDQDLAFKRRQVGPLRDVFLDAQEWAAKLPAAGMAP